LTTEHYYCQKCGGIERFTRYGNPVKSMRNRVGRCGEWGSVFTLMCCSLGHSARIVQDFSDHVWTEVYIDKLQKWVHVDVCELIYDTPFIYEKGWKSQITYIFAFSPDEVVDVTERYVSDRVELSNKRVIV
jgi:peptide-N4-(N-acetyl-beta-glucosaminyl)asparagine amidase